MHSLVALVMLLVGGPLSQSGSGPPEAPARPERPAVKRYRPTIVRQLPHDTTSWTQGLLHHGGALYESTGKWGRSKLRKLDPETGKVLRELALDRTYYGEGLALMDGRLVQITYKSETALVHSVDGFKLLGKYRYRGEGWGLTTRGKTFIMSNGGPDLIFRDESFAEIRRVRVKHEGKAVWQLNELELVHDRVFANIYGSTDILVISPETGEVRAIIDCRELAAIAKPRNRRTEVLNGIAFDPEAKLFYLTGKLWKYLFVVKLPETAWQ